MTKLTNDQAQASPTKQFFVSMLTRDINFADVILDLLDNCLDGALRHADGGIVRLCAAFREAPTRHRPLLQSKTITAASRLRSQKLRLQNEVRGARCLCGLAMGNTFFRGVDHLGLMASLPHSSIILLRWAV